MAEAQLVLDAARHRIGKVLEVFVLHLLRKGRKLLDRLAHRFDFLVRSAAALAVNPFVGAISITRYKFHFDSLSIAGLSTPVAPYDKRG